MLIDSTEVPEGKIFEHDVCIVGAGAAGITLAKELEGSGLSVALLESGGLENDAAVWDLYTGKWEVAGLGQRRDHNQTIKLTRLHYFGGTTNHWGGFCSPYDAIDFEVRDWVPDSGWPISLTDLEEYYERACPYVNVPSFNYDPEEEYRGHRQRPLYDFGPESTIGTKMFHRATDDPSGRGVPTHLGEKFQADLEAAADVTVYLKGSCTHVALDSAGGRVTNLQVKTVAGGNVFEIAAKHFVLAAGGLENTRLLLHSDDVHPTGIGNHKDLVGRYFMGHAHFTMDAGLFFAIKAQRKRNLPLYAQFIDPVRKHNTYGFFVVKEEFQRAHRLLNANMGGMVWTNPHEPETEADRAALGLLEGRDSEVLVRECLVNVEQEPNPESRVTLRDERDGLGMRRLQVSAKVTSQQVDSAIRSFELFGRELAANGVGRIKIDTSEEKMFWALPPRLGAHHMGTTRMAVSDSKGVVDSHCKVFGVENLFVSGASVFATGSCVNPTFTIVAMAVRLADRLKALS